MAVKAEKLLELSDLFPVEDIEWRIGRAYQNNEGSITAYALCYITSRAIHNRLDKVCGISNWEMNYSEWKNGAICTISILVEQPDGSITKVSKVGGSDQTDREPFKGMLSTAEKRAGVPWGIGRYLYELPDQKVDCFDSAFSENNVKRRREKLKIKGSPKDIVYYWEEPQLPNWAIPYEQSNDLDDIILKMKTYVKDSKEWNILNTEVRNMYKTGDVTYIVRKYGKDIINKLDEKLFQFQQKD